MRILFDQGGPAPLRSSLTEHDISTAYEMGWSTLINGELLRTVEENGFEVFVTTDQNLRHQQNLSNRQIAFVILSTTSWPRIQKVTALVIDAISKATPDQVQFVDVP